MEIGPLKSVSQHQAAPMASTPMRDRSHLTERFTASNDSDNSWRDEASQLNQLAQMARMRGYR